MLLLELVLCVFTFIHTGDGFGQPTISYITQEKVVDIGGSVEFDCAAQYADDYSVFWLKLNPKVQGGTTFISASGTLLLTDGRFSVRHDRSSSTYTLQIKGIQVQDARVYQCLLQISTETKKAANVTLKVRQPPVISDNSTRSVVVSERDRVELECYASGFPQPSISWRRENNAILPTGGSIYRGNKMTINKVTKEDRGTYYCVAENDVGRGVRRNVGVEVEFAPQVTAPRPRVGQAPRYDMNLECNVEAYPTPSISWHKNGLQLSNNQHYSISHFASADQLTSTTLRVITIEKLQYGQYVCRAANKLGTAEAKVDLFETVVPVCPPACEQPGIGGSSWSTPSLSFITICLLLATQFH